MSTNLDNCASEEHVNLSTANVNDKLRVYRCTLKAIRDLPDTIVPLYLIAPTTLTSMMEELNEVLQGLNAMLDDSEDDATWQVLEQIADYIRQARSALNTAITQRSRDDYEESPEANDAYGQHVGMAQNHLSRALRVFRNL